MMMSCVQALLFNHNNDINNHKTITIMRRSLLNKLNTPKALRQALVLITMLLLPSAAWAGDPIISTFTGYDATTSTITFGSGSTGEWSLYGDVTGVLGSYNNNTDKGLQITNSEGSYQSSFKLISNFTVSGTIANNETLCTITMGHSDSSIPNGSISIKYDPSNSQYTQEISTLQNSLTNGENTFKPMGGNGLTFENNHLIIEFNYLNPGSAAFYISSIQLSSELTKTITNYDIKICGTQVNSENASKVQGDYLSGGIKFTPASSSNNNTNTLTLNDATINGYIEYKSSDPLIIEFSGVNKVGVQNPGYITSDVATTLTLKKGEDNSSLSFSNSSSGLNYSSIHHFSNVEVLEGVYMQSSEYCRYVNNDFQDLYEGLVKYLTFTTTPTYPIWIGETQVTDDNKDHILGSSNATVTFTPASTSEDPSILTLNGANLNDTKIVSGLQNLTIHLKGENLIKGASETYPLSTAISSIVSTATLSFTSDVNAVNNPTGKLFFQYVTTPINGFNSDIVYNNGLEWGTIYDNSNNSYTGVGEVNYGLLIGNIQVTSANYSPIKDGDGNSIEASYNKTNNTLTLNGATINGRIEWNNGTNDLRICLSGKNSIICNKGEESPVSVFKSENTCTLFVEKVSDAESATLKYASYGTSGEKVINASSYLENFIFSANSTDFNQAPFTIMDGEIKYNYFTLKENIFPLTIAGIQVHNIEGEPGYKTDILGDGKVSFDGTNTLTLNNAEINVTGNGIETTEDLTIKLAGTNSITTTSGFPLYGILPQTGSSNRVVTFVSGSSPSGTLTLSSSGNLTEHVTVTSTDYNLESINWNTDKNAVIAKGFTGLTIAGTLITSEYLDANGVISGVSGITSGTVTYNATNSTLTLNSATINGPIKSNIDNLVVHLIGNNTMSGVSASNKPFQYTGSNTGSLAFTQEEVEDDNSSVFGRLEAFYENTSSFSWTDGYTISTAFKTEETGWVQETGTTSATIKYVEYYDLWISSMHFNSENLSGVSGGTVFYPKNNTLHLEGFGYSDIIKSQLADLIIEVSGSGNTPTAIIHEGSSNGTLLIKNAPSSSSTVNKLTLENSTGAVISGFSTVTLDGLYFLTPNYPSVTTSTDWTSSINKAIITNEALSAPTMSSETVDGVSTITLTSTADNSTIKYSIDYVDASQTDITDATYDSSNKPTINQPATVTAKVTLSEVESATTTGKYFGTDPSPFTLISGADPVNFVLAPAIDESDGISITSISGVESNVTYDAGTGKISSSTMGSFNGQVSMSSTDGKTVILNNNFTAAFTVQVDISQAVITLDNTELIYDGQEKTVTVQKVMVGDDVVPQDYYEVSGNTGTEIGNYTLTVTAKTRDSQGNPFNNIYTGTATKVWKITNYYTATATELGFSTETQTASTYYNPSENFNLPEGYVGYIITGVEGSKVLTTRISYIPKGVAVLVEKGTSAENPIEEIPDASEQPLKGTSEPLDVTSIIGGTVYVLYNGMFVKSTSGTIPSKRCYLLIATNVAAGTRGFTIDHGDGTSALRGVVAEGTNGKSDAWYTLQGRRLSAKPTAPGLYLHNGIKVVIK